MHTARAGECAERWHPARTSKDSEIGAGASQMTRTWVFTKDREFGCVGGSGQSSLGPLSTSRGENLSQRAAHKRTVVYAQRKVLVRAEGLVLAG